jgi:nucleotide-binding universal stress UspA family protein
MIEANPLGIVLAGIFACSMGILFFWMFHVPPALPLPVIKVRGSVEAVHKILVPIVEAISSERAVELACRLGNGKKAELVLLHVIVVPYALPLNAPMPEREKTAEHALELGNIIARRYGNHLHTHVIRHRNAAQGVLDVADQEQVDAIVLGVGKSRVPGEWGKTSQEILRRANCEVIVDKVPLAPAIASFHMTSS